MTKIVLVRHGATDWNVEKRAQGQEDVELNDEGRHQAAELAGSLSDWDIGAIYSSDLLRCVHTAEAIAQGRDVEVVLDRAFREIDQGDWAGLPVDEISRRWPDLWGRERHYTARPGGESPAQVRRRALEGLRRLVEAHPSGTAVVVTHGGTIRWVVAEALGYDDRQSARIRGLSNGGVVVLEGCLEHDRLRLRFLERMDGASPDADDPND